MTADLKTLRSRIDDAAAMRDDRVLRRIASDKDRFREAVDQRSLYHLMWVKFKIIDGCNIKCGMCNHWRRDEYTRNSLTRERMMKLAEELAQLGTRHVNWSGGEPTIRKDLPEIIGRMAELGIESSLITNGTLLTESYVERLLAARLTIVILSMESADPAIHDELVGEPGAWAKMRAGIERLTRDKARAPKLRLNTVLTAINIGPALAELVPLAASFGANKLDFTPTSLDHLSDADRRRLAPTPAQIHEFRTKLAPQMIADGARLGVGVMIHGDTQDRNLVAAEHLNRAARDHIFGYYQHPEHTCYLPYYHATIDFNGNVVACCQMRDGLGIVGNIAEAPLAEVLQSARATELRRRLSTADMPEGCAECTMQISENQAIDRILEIRPGA